MADRRQDGPQTMTFKVGNLKKHSEINIVLQIIMPLTISNGAYQFALPTTFYPDYQQLGAKNVDKHPYDFRFRAQIESTRPLDFISVPENSACIPSKDRLNAALYCGKPSPEMKVRFKSEEMKMPLIQYAESPFFPGEVAVSVSLVSAFGESELKPGEKLIPCVNENPQDRYMATPGSLWYVFMLDRSNTMTARNMENAKYAMKSFLRNLPAGS